MSSDSATEASDDTTEDDNALFFDAEFDSSLGDMSAMQASLRARYHAQKHPVDHILEQILDQMCTVTGEERSKIPRSPDGYLTSTKTIARRRIFRFWPRHPEGTIYHAAPAWKCKQAPNATHLWGATLSDFYHTYRVPSMDGMFTKTTGNRMAAWCHMVGELDTAKYELQGAENEPDPRRIEAADIVEIHEAQIDRKLPDTKYGKAVIAKAKEKGLQDEDAENRRKPFHPSSYPPPFPAPPFNFPAPKLETTIPLHLLPQKLTVHDPHNVLHAKRGSDEEAEHDSNRVNPWPFDCSDPSKPPPYETHTYELQLSQKSIDEVNRTRDELLASRSSGPESLCYIYPTDEEGPTDVPLIRIMVPPRPPKPVQTEEAHLFLSKHRRKGEGNHSYVYEAEWEIPRDLFVDPKICFACVEAKAKRVWAEQKNVESAIKQTSRTGSAGVADPGDDVVLPEMDDEQLRAYLAELEAQLDPVLTPVSSIPASPPAPDYLDPKLARIASCARPMQTCKTWATTSTHPAMLPNCGTVWIEAHQIPSAPAPIIHVRSIDEFARENRQKVQEANDRGEQKEWVYSEDVTESMKLKFEFDRTLVLDPGEVSRKKWEEEDLRRQSSATDVDSDTTTQTAPEGIKGPFEAPVNPETQDRYHVVIYYAGIVRTIHVSSVPWLLPGDPPCPIHGREYLYTPSLDPQKLNIPNPSINIRHLLFGTAFPAADAFPPTMKVGISAKISIPGDGHLAREATNYEKFPRHFAEHWSGYNLCYPLHDPTPCGAITPAFYGFYKKVVGQMKAREHDGEVFVEGGMDTEDNGDKETYFSPLLLLEDCGEPIDPDRLNLDDRNECAALLFRFHHHRWTHGSFFPRNILMRRGDHADRPMERSEKDKRFRLIDFGRSRYLEDLPADDEKARNEWDLTRFDEKGDVWHTMSLPNFT